MVDVTKKWRRSSYCADGACVEVADLGDRFAIRDAKNPGQPAIEVPREDWPSFLDRARASLVVK